MDSEIPMNRPDLRTSSPSERKVIGPAERIKRMFPNAYSIGVTSTPTVGDDLSEPLGPSIAQLVESGALITVFMKEVQK